MIYKYRVQVESDRAVTFGACTDNSSTNWSVITSGYNGHNHTGYTCYIMQGKVISSAHHVFNYATNWKLVLTLSIRENTSDIPSSYDVNLNNQACDYVPLHRLRAVTSSGTNYACGYRSPTYISNHVGTISTNSNTLKIVTDQEYVGTIYNNNRPVNFRENGMTIKLVLSLLHGNIQAYPNLDYSITDDPFLELNADRWVHISNKDATSIDTSDNTFGSKTFNSASPSSAPSWNGSYLWFVNTARATTNIVDSSTATLWEINSGYSVNAMEINGYVWPKSQCVAADL